MVGELVQTFTPFLHTNTLSKPIPTRLSFGSGVALGSLQSGIYRVRPLRSLVSRSVFLTTHLCRERLCKVGELVQTFLILLCSRTVQTRSSGWSEALNVLSAEGLPPVPTTFRQSSPTAVGQDSGFSRHPRWSRTAECV